MNDVEDHGPTANQVEWLGSLGAHASSLASSQNYGVDGQVMVISHATALNACHCDQDVGAPGRGLEPLFAESKSAVLPLNDPGKSDVSTNDALNLPFRTESARVHRNSFIETGQSESIWYQPMPDPVWMAGNSSVAWEPCRRRGCMGSLIKKRRKRMRKKKHKKMLRRTRHQRRK